MENEPDISQYIHSYKYDILTAELGAILVATNIGFSFCNWDPISRVNLYSGIAGGIAAGVYAVRGLLKKRSESQN